MNKKVKRLTLLLVTLALTATAILAGLGGKANAAIKTVQYQSMNGIINYGSNGTAWFDVKDNNGFSYKAMCTRPELPTPVTGHDFGVLPITESSTFPDQGAALLFATAVYYSDLGVGFDSPEGKRIYDIWANAPTPGSTEQKKIIGLHIISSFQQWRATVFAYPYAVQQGMEGTALQGWWRANYNVGGEGIGLLESVVNELSESQKQKIMNSVFIANMEIAYGTQSFVFVNPVRYGHLNLSKVSSMVNYTDQNPGYSLNGAEYGVFSDAGANNRVGTLTIDANGVSNTIELEVGDYWVKEVKAPTGFHLDSTIHKVTVDEG